MTTALAEMPPIDAAPTPPAEDTAPKKRRGRPPGSTDKAPRARASSTRRSSTPSLEKRLNGSLTTLGTLACLVSPADGMAVVQGVPALSTALAKLADENNAVRVNLERMLTAGAWSGVVAAVVPIALGIAANHNMVPPQIAAMLGGAGPDGKAPDAS